jgi:hypothetical protein
MVTMCFHGCAFPLLRSQPTPGKILRCSGAELLGVEGSARDLRPELSADGSNRAQFRFEPFSFSSLICISHLLRNGLPQSSVLWKRYRGL